MTNLARGMCAHHLPAGPEDYRARYKWAQAKLKNGERQKQCRNCRYWFFKEEMGNEQT